MKPQIISSLKKAGIKLPEKQIKSLIEIPPSTEMGDFAFPCFILAKEMKKNPNQIAEELAKKIKSKEFEKVESKGPYINFFVNRITLAENLIKEIKKQGDKFGSSKETNKTVMFEFSQPNTHKAFHVGHIRGTSLGESLSRIYEFSGNKVIRANYSGDTGMHIAKWIWCYQKYHAKEKLKDDEAWIASIYVDAVRRLKENETLQEEVKKINKKIDERSDKKINELWEKTRKLSIDSWKKIYKELNTKFDKHYFEGTIEQKGKAIAKELLNKKIAEISDSATIVDLKKFDMGVWVVLRSDGTVLYSAKDLALAEQKYKDYPKLSSSFVLIAYEQDFYFRQLEKILELINFKHAKDYHHISFGMVRLPTGKMSSRTGDNILYSDFMKDITDFAKKRIKKTMPAISQKELDNKAEKISIAAIKYSMLKQSPNKNIVFKKEDALSFEGDTGPYIQYSYVRASSILRKVKSQKEKTKIRKLEQKEIELIKKLSEFQDIVQKAYTTLNPSLIANYSYQLAQTFNEFYHTCPVMNSEKQNFRIELVDSFRQVLKNSLGLLGIDVLERM